MAVLSIAAPQISQIVHGFVDSESFEGVSTLALMTGYL